MFARIVRFVDWRFLVALIVLLLVTSVAQSARTQHLQNEQLIEQSARKDKIWDAERAAAANERRELLQGQRDLTEKYDRLVSWLNAQNIVVPEQVLTGRTSIVHTTRDDDDGDDDGSGKQSPPKS